MDHQACPHRVPAGLSPQDPQCKGNDWRPGGQGVGEGALVERGHQVIDGEGPTGPFPHTGQLLGQVSTGRRKVPTLPSPPAFDTAAASSAEVKTPMPGLNDGKLDAQSVHNGVCSMMLLPEKGLIECNDVLRQNRFSVKTDT